MKFPLRLILALLMAAVALPALAGNEQGNGCKPLGSWLGYDAFGSAWWMTTTDGQSASHGTVNLEVPGATAFFPGSAGGTEMRGVWEKLGGNQVAWTVVGFVFDADQVTLALARVSGKSNWSPDCNTEHLSDVLLEAFAPDADLDVDAPLWTTPLPDHDGHRVKLVIYDLP